MDKYKWDLKKIFKSTKEYKNTINEIYKLLDEIKLFKGKLLDNLEETLVLDSKIDELCEKVYVFSHLGHYDNMKDKEFLELKELALSTYIKSKEIRSFINPELLSYEYDELIKIINNNPKLAIYKFNIERLFRYKKHTLSEKEEKILANAGEIFDLPDTTYNVLNNVDIKLDDIKDENGKKIKLTNSNYGKMLSSKNENIRKNAFKSMYKYYKNNINTISSLYIGKVKINKYIKEIRQYDGILSMYLFGDKIDNALYKNLIEAVDKNLNLLKDYYKIKSRVLNKKLHMYDTYVDIAFLSEKDIKYEDAVNIVKSALNILGQDYINNFNYLLKNNIVDVYPKEYKRSGAYQWGCYSSLPYVSLNYENNIDSVSTFAHEMGHAMHSLYSNKNQSFEYAGYPIFLAEIASTVNEILLSNYLINNTKDVDEKISYITGFLDKFKATVYRQTMFAEFEYIINKMCEDNETITSEILCDVYYKLNKKHFSPVLKVDEEIKYEWARIPHFYSSFYVYKYATGFICASIIVNRLLNEKDFNKKYIEFLSSGGNDYPLNILNKIGIDINDKKVINEAFEIFKDKVKQLDELLKEKGV